jgi:hypothetical protein
MIRGNKINTLLQSLPHGLVLQSAWLAAQGYSYGLQQRYRNSGWLQSIGKGAMIRAGEPLRLSGALASLQTQTSTEVHVGGRSALEYLGQAQYLRLGKSAITLFTNNAASLPSWFTDNQWDSDVQIHSTALFGETNVGYRKYQDGDLEIQTSDGARAVMECMALCPNKFWITEAYELMENLPTLHPTIVQKLLEECKSIKVKRLFLYFAERLEHLYFKYLDTSRITLGAGNRTLCRNGEEGQFISKYQIVMPRAVLEL